MKDNKRFQKYLHSSTIFYVCGLLLFFIIATQIGSATIFLQNGTEVSGDKIIETLNNSGNVSPTPFPIQFFYNTHCGSCQDAIEYLTEFTKKNMDIKAQYHDLYNSSENNTIYNQYKEKFNNTTNIHYPVVFIGDVGISGSNDISNYTESLSTWYLMNKKQNL